MAMVAGTVSTHSQVRPLSDKMMTYYHLVKALDAVSSKDSLRVWGNDKNSIRIALQVLPCQLTPGDVERTTSKGSLTVTKLRNRLKGKTISDLVSAASLCATREHTTRKKKTVEHFDTFVYSMVTFAKSDDNSKLNEN